MARTKSIQDRGLIWTALILFASVPLLVAAIVLQIVGPIGDPLSGPELSRLHSALSRHAFLPGALTYAGMIVIHFFACVASILFACLVLRSAPKWQSLAWTGIGMAVSLAVLIPLLALVFRDSIAAYRLSFFAYENLYQGTGAGTWLLDRRHGLFRPLDLAAYLPTVLGIFAVAITAAAATGQVRLLHRKGSRTAEAQEALLCLTHARVKRCAYALSFVLVTSTVAAALFFQLPSKIYLSDAALVCCANAPSPSAPSPSAPSPAAQRPNAPTAAAAPTPDLARLVPAARARVDAFASELTMFWGAIFTLTLLAAVGLPLLLVQKRVLDFVEALHPPERAEGARARMTKAGALSGGGEQIKILFAFVAPLVSAPVTSFLQAAAT